MKITLKILQTHCSYPERPWIVEESLTNPNFWDRLFGYKPGTFLWGHKGIYAGDNWIGLRPVQGRTYKPSLLSFISRRQKAADALLLIKENKEEGKRWLDKYEELQDKEKNKINKTYAEAF